MPDREKVIHELKTRLAIAEENNNTYVPVVKIDTIRKILALLKEQEAITIKKTKEHGFCVYGGICPKCRNWIQSAHSYCGFCGQAVKWE